MLRTIVEGEPGIFPDPVARLMRTIGGWFGRRRGEEHPPGDAPPPAVDAPPRRADAPGGAEATTDTGPTAHTEATTDTGPQPDGGANPRG